MSSDSDSSNIQLAEIGDVENLKPPKIISVNDVEGLKEKLSEIKVKYDWVEKLDLSVDLSKFIEDKSKDGNMLETTAEHDFKREMAFYNQAKEAASEGLKLLSALGIPTKRPADYFAEMAKSDAHMQKVREKLLSKQAIIERSQKAKELREQKKHGKKMQQEILRQRKSEKKAMLEALKKTKKGKLDASKLLEGPAKPPTNKKNFQKLKGKKFKEQYKSEKYGYGGKKKGSKYNTAESSSFLPGNKSSFSKGKKHFGKKKQRSKSTRRRR